MSYLHNTLNEDLLERLAFDYDRNSDYWHDIDSQVLIYELLDGSGFQQFIFDDDRQTKYSFGIPLRTVEDLMNRYKSITGYNARYWEGELPINAQ